MKIIKLTSALNDTEVYLNIKHLVAFWEEDGETIFVTTCEDGIGRVKETPEEIIELIKQAKEINMDKKFNKEARKIIAKYLGCSEEQVYCVWCCKTLHRIKGLFSSDVSNAKDLYWEITYNGIKKELYVDRYKKVENKAISIEL